MGCVQHLGQNYLNRIIQSSMALFRCVQAFSVSNVGKRNVSSERILEVFQCWMYEFEDVIAEVDAVHLLAPVRRDEPPVSTFARRVGNRVRSLRGRPSFVGTIERTLIDQKYELFFAIFMFPSQVALLEFRPDICAHESKCASYRGSGGEAV